MIRRTIRRWIRWVHEAVEKDHPVGPQLHHRKMAILNHFFQPGAPVVETGTYLGQTTSWLAAKGFHVHSIEIHEPLYRQAVASFAGNRNVTLYLGDSGVLLPTIIASVGSPAMNFWLDGHYSGGATGKADAYDNPISKEVECILDKRSTGDLEAITLCIDDFRSFSNDPAYPTKEWLVDVATRSGLHWTVVGDIFVMSTARITDA